MAQQWNNGPGGNRPGGYQGRPDQNRGQQGGQSYQRDTVPVVDEKTNLDKQKSAIEGWVRDGIDKSTVEFADTFGKKVADDGLTTTQIRTFFGEMRRIQMNGYLSEKTSFILLKPKLAYAVKRHKKEGLTKFYNFFSIAYDAVDTTDNDKGVTQFGHVMNLLEAVLAYHKFYSKE